MDLLAKRGCTSFTALLASKAPVPGADGRTVCEALDVRKDMDCMPERSLCGVFTGSGAGSAPRTAQSCMEILKYYGYDPAGNRAAVIGRSLVIGRSVSMLLMRANATVTMCHTKTADLPGVCRAADIPIVAAGRPGTVDRQYVHPGQIVIDVGINLDAAGKLCGDVKCDEILPYVRAITPVPSGVGNVTTAVLCSHVIEAAERGAT